MVNVAVVYHSRYGHTKKQAEAVARGAAQVAGVKVDLVSVEELPGPDAQRQLTGGRWPAVHAAHALIMGAPTYMGSVSAGLKEFMEHTSGVWFQQQWRDKLAAGFTNSGSWSGDKLNTLVDMAVFAAQHGMIWVGLGLLPGNNSSKASPADLNRVGAFLGAMAQSNVDQGPDVAPPESDLKTAEHLGARVATAAKRWFGEAR